MYKILSSLFSFLYLIQCFPSANASTINQDILEIRGSCLFVPSRLGDIYVQHDIDGFHVISDEKTFLVHQYNIDKSLRCLTNEQLVSFLNIGSLIVGTNYLTDEDEDKVEYTLRGYVRGLGGMDVDKPKKTRSWSMWAEDVVIPWVRGAASSLDSNPPPGSVIIAGPGSTINNGGIHIGNGGNTVNVGSPKEKK